jgi:preprotein translocase subunit YajC
MNIAFLNILADAPAPVTGGNPGLDMTNQLVWFGAILVMMWLLMIRPQQKKQKALLARIAAIKTGDRVVTTGGVHGVVTNVKDGPTLVLKVDDNCKLTVDKSAVVTVLTKEANSAA